MDVLEKHTEQTTHSEGQNDTTRGDLSAAQAANTQEHQLTFWKSVKAYPKAIGWSVLLSTAIVMEGYDTKLIGSLQAQPAFRRNYGVEVKPDSYQVTAPWQAGLGNGATVGQCFGLALVGVVTDRFGFKRTNMVALLMMVAFIFIPFFAPNIKVLLVGQILCGIPWGVFQTLSTAYAVEVCPLHLRGYLTTYVNLCWVRFPFDSSLLRPLPLLLMLIGLFLSRYSDNSLPQEFFEVWRQERTSGHTGSLLPSNGYGPSHSRSDPSSHPSRRGGVFARTRSPKPNTI